MPRAYGARAQMLLALESAYGQAPASGYARVPFATTDYGGSTPLLESELLGFGPDPLPPERDVESVDGNIVVPADPEAFGLWLTALMGSVTPSGTDPYTRVWSSGAPVLPSFTVEMGMPEVPAYRVITGGRVNSLSITKQRGGQLQATLACIGQGETAAAVSGAGTPISYGTGRFLQRHGAVTRAGAALANITGATFTYSNNLDAVPTIRSDGRIEDLEPTRRSFTGQMTLRFASETLFNDAAAGDPVAFSFAFTRSAGETLTFAAPYVYLAKPKLPVEGPNGIEATFDFQGAQGPAGEAMLTTTLVGPVETYP